jgi:hypothetical protein
MTINKDCLMRFLRKIDGLDICTEYKQELDAAIADINTILAQIKTIVMIYNSGESLDNQLASFNIAEKINAVKLAARDLIPFVEMHDANMLRSIIDEDVIINDYTDDIICDICGEKMIYNYTFYKCVRCDIIVNNTKENIYVDLVSQDIKSRNDNITKHLCKNLSQIYGECWDDRIPTEVEEAICKNLRAELPNLFDRVHYTYEVYEKLHAMKNIKFLGKTYYPKKYKIYSNTFIRRAFPNVKIPQLEPEDHDLLFNTFLSITAEHQNITSHKMLDTRKYNINYLYIIHRILYMKLRAKPYVITLLRFIYIQKPSSFSDKDKKLFKVNNRISCFENFYYTPENIYVNNKYY